MSPFGSLSIGQQYALKLTTTGLHQEFAENFSTERPGWILQRATASSPTASAQSPFGRSWPIGAPATASGGSPRCLDSALRSCSSTACASVAA